ncbi:hypothetical protein JXB12_11185 [candidate division KSB1 bacterium]|nr:hypothetical protein [candidate division KSB1 bacterium]
MTAYSMHKNKNILSRFLIAFLFMFLVFLATCATVGINNYQNAETLGKNKLKLGLAFELGREMDAGIDLYEGEISYQDTLWEGEMSDFVFPILEFSVQYGITNSTDIGLNYTTGWLLTSGGGSIFLKQNLLHTKNNFAIAILPRAGIYGSESESEFTSDIGNFKEISKENYSGTQYDISLIISKRWDFFTIQLSPKYLYNGLSLETDYKNYENHDDKFPTTHKKSKKTIYYRTYGASAGLSFRIQNFRIIPEVSYLRVKDLPLDKYTWALFPGLGFSVTF